MRLRYQLLSVSMVLLLLPWGGYHLIQKLEATLRDIQQENLRRALLLARSRLIRSERISSVFSGLNSQVGQLYAYPLAFAPITDGYGDEWHTFHAKPVTLLPITGDGFGATCLAGFFKDRLYVFLQVRDSRVIYHEPYRPENLGSDQVIVRLIDKSEQGRAGRRVIRFQPIAPGPISAVSPSGQLYDVSAYWQDTPAGYNLELDIPLKLVSGGFGLSVINDGTDLPGLEPARLAVTSLPSGEPAVNQIVRRDAGIEKLLADYAMPTTRMTLTDKKGRVIARTGALGPGPKRSQSGQALFTRFLGTVFRWLILEDAPPMPDNGDPARDTSELVQGALAGKEQTLWFTTPDNHTALSSVALPVEIDGEIAGVIRIDQRTDSFATLSSSTIVDVILASLTIYLLVTLVLLGFASLISWRIRQLNRSIKETVSPDGQITGKFRASNSNDEIGDLSRNFQQMVVALNGYTDYLETFARKLGHEIKTPIAIVSSSLDNLNQAESESDQRQYIERAKEGCSRLAAILTSMREATRLEDSIQHAEKEWFDLAGFVSGIGMAYQGMLADFRFSYKTTECGELPFWGSPDLLARLLDKLIENAKDFTPGGGRIGLSLSRAIDRNNRQAGYDLSVFNEGAFLPDMPGQDIFSSFVSLRDRNDQVHLGMGLVIVKLIVQYHDGDVRAINDPHLPGVRFTIRLPLTQKKSGRQ